MLEDLLLLRLWTVRDAGRGEIRSKVAADLRPLAGEPGGNPAGWRTLFAEVVDRLMTADCLIVSGRGGARLALSNAGRARVCSVFKIPEKSAPAQAKDGRAKGWTWWRDHHALPLALGGDRADNADALRGALLRRFYLPELPSGTRPDGLQKTVDFLLAKRLKVSRVSPAAFRLAALREWAASPLDEGAAKIQGRLPDALPVFAEQTRLAARRAPTGRFGDKVFVSHVWRVLLAAGQADPGEADEFKARLLRANTAGLLRLSRADLAGAHGAEDVRDSEVRYLGETFHFVRLD